MKRSVASIARLALSLATAALLLIGAACGSDSADAETKGSGGPAATVDAAGSITIVAKDNSYAPKEFSTKAGQKTTVTLENKGSAIHNLQIKDQKGADGQDIQTALLPGGQTGSVEFSLNPGTYDFLCTVHPVEMRGKIKVT